MPLLVLLTMYKGPHSEAVVIYDGDTIPEDFEEEYGGTVVATIEIPDDVGMWPTDRHLFQE